MSRVTCHVSRVTCHMSKKKNNYILFIYFIYLFIFLRKKKLDKVVELVGGGSVINGAYPVYFITGSANSDRLGVAVPENCGRKRMTDLINEEAVYRAAPGIARVC